MKRLASLPNFTGQLASLVDIAPNYASIVLGLIGLICVTPGFLSPILVSYLTFENQTVHQWQIVFLITGSILIVSGVLYVLFSDSTEQKWNRYGEKEFTKSTEVISLNINESCQKSNINDGLVIDDNKVLLVT